MSQSRESSRERLLAVAQTLFLDEGYHGVTMERVAAAAGMSKVTLYKHFSDKDALLLALVRERRIAPGAALGEHRHAAIERARLALDGADNGRAIDETVLALLQDATERRNDAFFRLLVEIALDQPSLLAHLKQEAFGTDGGRVWAELGRGLARKLPYEVDPEVLGQLLFATVIGYAVVQPVVLGEHRVSRERLAEGLATVLRGGSRTEGETD